MLRTPTAQKLPAQTLRIELSASIGDVSGIRHALMEAVATECAVRRIATFRYQFPFPYMEQGKRLPHAQRAYEQ